MSGAKRSKASFSPGCLPAQTANFEILNQFGVDVFSVIVRRIQRTTLGSWAMAIQKRSIPSIIISIILLLSGFVMYPFAWLS